MNDLALQIRFVHGVELDDAQGSDAGGGQVEQRRAAQTAGTDHQHTGVLQPFLTVHPDVGNDQVTAVTPYLLDGQFGGRFDQRR